MPVFIPDEMLDRIIDEDVPYSDLTSEILGINSRTGRIVFSTREPTVVCCTEEAGRIFQKFGATIKFTVPSGNTSPPVSTFLKQKVRPRPCTPVGASV